MKGINQFAALVALVFAISSGGTAQTPAGTGKLLSATLTIESNKLAQEKPVSVSVSIMNVSGREIDIGVVCFFKLLKADALAAARNFAVFGDSYWSPVDILTGKPLQLSIDPKTAKKGISVGSVPRTPLHLGVGEAKVFHIGLAQTFWNDSTGNDWPRW